MVIGYGCISNARGFKSRQGVKKIKKNIIKTQLKKRQSTSLTSLTSRGEPGEPGRAGAGGERRAGAGRGEPGRAVGYQRWRGNMCEVATQPHDLAWHARLEGRPLMPPESHVARFSLAPQNSASAKFARLRHDYICIAKLCIIQYFDSIKAVSI